MNTQSLDISFVLWGMFLFLAGMAWGSIAGYEVRDG
jgi:hypothetical protein